MTDPAVVPAVDPWEDDQFAPLDLRSGPQGFVGALTEIANDDPAFAPTPDDEPIDPAVAPVIEAPPAPQYAPAETFEVEGGGTVTYEEDDRGWHATLEYKTGEPIEVFHARSALELSKQLAVGKLNASKKINQLNKQVKLATKKAPVPVQPAITQPTADQIFEIKTLAQTDLFAAFDKMLQIKAGASFDDFVAWVKSGKDADKKLTHQETVNKFFASHPSYYRSEANNNKIGEYLDEHNKELTLENLNEAFKDLTEAGLLESAPKPQTRPVVVATPPTPVPVVTPPVVPTPTPRIERPVGRANATLGLRANETTVVRPAPVERVPSAEELDNLPDDQINQLFAGVVRTKAQQSTRR